MTTITYLDSNREEQTFSVDLPNTLYCRLNLEYKLNYVSSNSEFYESDPANLYHYTEVLSSVNTLFAFIVSYKYDLIEKTPELDILYNTVITYNDAVTVLNRENEVEYLTPYIEQITIETKDDYVAPTVQDPDSAPPLEGAVGSTPSPIVAEAQ